MSTVLNVKHLSIAIKRKFLEHAGTKPSGHSCRVSNACAPHLLFSLALIVPHVHVQLFLTGKILEYTEAEGDVFPEQASVHVRPEPTG